MTPARRSSTSRGVISGTRSHKRWHDSRLASRVPETNPVIEIPVLETAVVYDRLCGLTGAIPQVPVDRATVGYAIIGRLIECQDLVGREEGHHLFEPGARSILVAPKSEVLYTLAAQVVRVQHAA